MSNEDEGGASLEAASAAGDGPVKQFIPTHTLTRLQDMPEVSVIHQSGRTAWVEVKRGVIHYEPGTGQWTEKYEEWRLSGQPPGEYPFYDLTFRDRERVESLVNIWDRVRTGERGWADAKFQRREVTITRTAWQDADAVRPER